MVVRSNIGKVYAALAAGRDAGLANSAQLAPTIRPIIWNASFELSKSPEENYLWGSDAWGTQKKKVGK